MLNKRNYMTRDGIEKLEQRLEYLKTIRRQEVANRIKAAIELGDLSENSEYDDAKNEQAFLEGEIKSIEMTLSQVEIIDESTIAHDIITVGTSVVLTDQVSGKTIRYNIVGSDEADPFLGKISNESPVGTALEGKRQGDTIEVSTPSGIKKLHIDSISR